MTQFSASPVAVTVTFFLRSRGEESETRNEIMTMTKNALLQGLTDDDIKNRSAAHVY